DAEAGQRIVLAIALDRLVVDVVVAEAAEVEIRDGAVAVAVGPACRATQPQRRMRERQREAVVDLPAHLGRDLASCTVAGVDQRPRPSFLVVDRAEGAL